MESYRKALAIYESLYAADPSGLKLRSDIADSYNHIGESQAQGALNQKRLMKQAEVDRPEGP